MKRICFIPVFFSGCTNHICFSLCFICHLWGVTSHTENICLCAKRSATLSYNYHQIIDQLNRSSTEFLHKHFFVINALRQDGNAQSQLHLNYTCLPFTSTIIARIQLQQHKAIWYDFFILMPFIIHRNCCYNHGNVLWKLTSILDKERFGIGLIVS